MVTQLDLGIWTSAHAPRPIDRARVQLGRLEAALLRVDEAEEELGLSGLTQEPDIIIARAILHAQRGALAPLLARVRADVDRLEAEQAEADAEAETKTAEEGP